MRLVSVAQRQTSASPADGLSCKIPAFGEDDMRVCPANGGPSCHALVWGV